MDGFINEKLKFSSMIHVFVGTKAQFIKMAPVMQELDRRGIAYNFIDAGQHGELTGGLAQEFGLRVPDVFLRPESRNVNTLFEAITWATESLSQIALKREEVFQRIFRGEGGICLIHGDTLTTLLSLLYAKRCGIKVAHVEAGLRSYHLLNPFPEEMIRLIAMRFSDILFAPSEWAFQNLHKMGFGVKTVNAGGNTIVDTLRYARRRMSSRVRPNGSYAVITIHRVETIFSRSRWETILTLLERIAMDRQALFVLHEPTRRQLERFDLVGRLSQRRAIEILPLQPYLVFVDLLAGADFIVTDGGSIQEESYFLNVPCLILRGQTERLEGLGQNAFLAGFDPKRIDGFLQTFSSFRRQNPNEDVYPSMTIVDHLSTWV
jgi:UDP-N-acetylglucosamine 2-epimerase